MVCDELRAASREGEENLNELRGARPRHCVLGVAEPRHLALDTDSVQSEREAGCDELRWCQMGGGACGSHARLTVAPVRPHICIASRMPFF